MRKTSDDENLDYSEIKEKEVEILGIQPIIQIGDHDDKSHGASHTPLPFKKYNFEPILLPSTKFPSHFIFQTHHCHIPSSHVLLLFRLFVVNHLFLVQNCWLICSVSLSLSLSLFLPIPLSLHSDKLFFQKREGIRKSSPWSPLLSISFQLMECSSLWPILLLLLRLIRCSSFLILYRWLFSTSFSYPDRLRFELHSLHILPPPLLKITTGSYFSSDRSPDGLLS